VTLHILKRIKKGGKTGRGGTSNRYRFCIDIVSGQPLKEVPGETPLQSSRQAKEVSGGTPKRCQASPERGVRRDTQSSKDNLKDNLRDGSASSSALGAVVGVAESLSTSDNQISEQADTEPRLTKD
jgi:hypothetical protein